MSKVLFNVGGWFVCGLLFFAGLSAGDTEHVVMFPKVQGRSLQGNDVLFPDAFAVRPYHVVLVAFEQEQQPEVDTWLPKLELLAGERNDLGFFEVPTIARLNAVVRWIIYRGMRSGIKDEAARARTVTLHIDKDPFKQALGVTSESYIRSYLVDEQGKVLWQGKGPWDETQWSEMKANLP